MKFQYTAFDKAGKKTAGVIDAGTAGEAAEFVRKQGLFVSQISHANEGTATASVPKSRKVRTNTRLKYVANFARQMHVLVNGGTPLTQALATIERQTENARWKAILEELRTKVERGGSLSEGMKDRPEWFDSISRSLISAGEVSGAMPPMLERLAALARKQLHLRSSIGGALVYPCLLILVAVNVLVSMLLFVLPRFAGMFKTIGSPLPPTTKVLFWMSDELKEWWWAFVPPIIIIVFLFKRWIGTEKGRLQIQTFILRIPKVGKIVKNLIAARLARLLGTLLESQVPLLDALELTRQSAINLHYQKLFAHAADVVSRGEPMSAAFASTDLVNASIVEAIRTGEQTGRIGTPLLQVADFMDEENEIIVKTITGLLEPAILVVLGVVIGGVAISMFLPLFDLAASASGGG